MLNFFSYLLLFVVVSFHFPTLTNARTVKAGNAYGESGARNVSTSKPPATPAYPRMQTYNCKGAKGGTVSVIDLDPNGQGSLPFPDDRQGDYILFQHGYSQGLLYSSEELDVTNDIMVVIHGLEEKMEGVYRNLISELFNAKPRADVIFVDWTEAAGTAVVKSGDTSPASEMSYERAVSNTRVVGGCLARWLEANRYFDASKAYCIGLGLGAHTCGFAGKTFTRAKWGRITALDPLEREFNIGEYSRVSRNDTGFLDVIHTSCITYSFGIGHVDYFVNNVKEPQFGCGNSDLAVCNPTGPSAALRKASSMCSHIRALKIFTSSINDRCCLLFCSWHSSVYCRQAGFWAYSYPYEKFGNFYGNLSAKTEPYCIFRAPAPCYAYNSTKELVVKSSKEAVVALATTRRTGPTKWYDGRTTTPPTGDYSSQDGNNKSNQILIAPNNSSFYLFTISSALFVIIMRS